MVAVTDVQLFANNRSATLNSDVAVPDGSIVLATGLGATWPSPAAGQFFALTLQNTITGAYEVCYCTDRTGDLLTVERAQEGTAAQAFVVATAVVQLRLTKGTLEKLIQRRFTGADVGKYLQVQGSGEVTTSAGVGGVSDHGALTGLADDDHPQYGALAQNETVTGQWTFPDIRIERSFDGEPDLFFNDSAQALDQKKWAIKRGASGAVSFLLRTDADADGEIFLNVIRAGSSAIGLSLSADYVATNGAIIFTATLNPSQITSNQNDYAPTGLDSVVNLRISSDAARSITGISGGTAGRYLTITNIGSFTITLVNQSGSSIAGNRFTFGADGFLDAGQTVHLVYDQVTSRWRDSATWTGASEYSVVPDIRTQYKFFDDFTTSNVSGSLTGWDSAITAAGGTAGIGVSGGSGHPGVLRLTSGTGSNSTIGFIRQSDASTAAAAGVSLGGGIITIDILFRFITALSVVTTDVVRPNFGMMDEVSGVPGNGIYLDTAFSGSTLKVIGTCRTTSVDTTTTVASGLTAALNTWYHGRIVINAAGSSVEFFVDGVSLGTVASGIPTAILNPALQWRRTTTGTNIGVEVDVYQIVQTFTTPRWT